MIFSRLRSAIREQNWFGVLLEIAIVVLGVAIGFQVTSWGQARADRRAEHIYLRQLAADLSATEMTIASVDRQLAPSEAAARQLYDQFRSGNPLPTDSILVLISRSTVLLDLNPILGTTEALVATGDLALIRNDSLRAAIPYYLEQQRSLKEMRAAVSQSLWEAVQRLGEQVDMADADAALTAAGGVVLVPRPQAAFDATGAATTSPFPLDARQFLADAENYHAVYWLHHMKIQAAMLRDAVLDLAQNLHRQVEAELGFQGGFMGR